MPTSPLLLMASSLACACTSGTGLRQTATLALKLVLSFTSTLTGESYHLSLHSPQPLIINSVSNRLTGGPANSNCLTALESGGMGEGWGDFMATAIRLKSGD